jgi:hypothetical protein
MHRPWTQEEVDYLIATHPTRSVAEQARALKRSPYSVLQKRRILHQAGRISPAERARFRRWTNAELAELHELIRDGLSLGIIAGRLRRTKGALIQRINEDGVSVGSIRRDGLFKVRTLTDIEVMFGVHWSKARRWVTNGWLKAQSTRARLNVRTQRVKGAHILISDLALQEFLDNPAAWGDYDPARITDPDWREAAIEARREARHAAAD